MHPVLFKIGNFTIYTYGFLVGLGVLLGYWTAKKEAEFLGLREDIFSNLCFWIIIWGFVGARLFYILVEVLRNKIFSFKFVLSLILSRSGFVFYGGVIFGLAAAIFIIKKYRTQGTEINFLKFADSLSPAIALGHSLGRLGCFFYGCCYGKPTTSFLGVLFPPQSPAGQLGLKRIPTQIISAIFLFLFFLVLRRLNRDKNYSEGRTFLFYLLGYGVFRFIIEFFRDDPRGFVGFLSTSQIISLIVILLSIYFIRLRKENRHPKWMNAK